jgi:UDP-glucose 4-epimerase
MTHIEALDAGAQLKDARVLVTGGLGFIGSRLALRLAALGARVTIVDNMVPDTGANTHHSALLEPRADVRIADVRDAGVVNAALKNQDILFNLAALVSHMDSMREPLDDLDINARAPAHHPRFCPRGEPADSHRAREHAPGIWPRANAAREPNSILSGRPT